MNMKVKNLYHVGEGMEHSHKITQEDKIGMKNLTLKIVQDIHLPRTQEGRNREHVFIMH